MLKKIYNWFYTLTSSAEDKGEYGSGYFQGKIRKESLALCLGRQGRILEIGCGAGLFSVRLAQQNSGSEIWIIDNEQEKLNYVENRAREKGINNLRLSLQDAASLSFENGYFDAVVCINFLYMMDSFEKVKHVLGQMERVCKSQGRIIFEFRNARNLLFLVKYKLAKFYDATVKDNPLNCFNLEQIEEILAGLNLKVTRKKYPCSFLFKRLAPIIIIEAQKND